MFTVVDDAKLPPVVVASPKVEVAGTCALQPPVALPDVAQYADISASQLTTAPWSALVISDTCDRFGTAPAVIEDDVVAPEQVPLNFVALESWNKRSAVPVIASGAASAGVDKVVMWGVAIRSAVALTAINKPR